MRWISIVIVIAGLGFVPPAALGQPGTSPEASVFQVVVMTESGGDYYGVSMGTAFFTGADGVALTNSHVVYRVSHDPRRYQLLALRDKEFYSAAVVCASQLPYDPTRASTGSTYAPASSDMATILPGAPGAPFMELGGVVKLGRDVAAIKLSPSKFPFTHLGFRGQEIAAAHLGALPRFPALTVKGDPAVGDPVRVLGFAQDPLRPVLTRKWMASGTVSALDAADDGTRLVRIGFLRRPEGGGSGSPILDDQNRVVGILAWGEKSSLAYDIAIGGSALLEPCPAASRTGPTGILRAAR